MEFYLKDYLLFFFGALMAVLVVCRLICLAGVDYPYERKEMTREAEVGFLVLNAVLLILIIECYR